MRPDRADLAAEWDIEDMIRVLLRQFKRVLAAQGVDLSDADAERIAAHVAAKQPPTEETERLRDATLAAVKESEGVLAELNLGFVKSLDTQMTDLPGWESTADFLDLANTKANAELRIGAGSALAAALGDLRHSDYLLHLAVGDYDVESVIAKRVLSFLSGVDANDPAWSEKVQAWLEMHG